MKKVFIVAGDPSADKYSANMMNELKKLIPDISFVGIGGPQMIEAGLVAIATIAEVSVVGFWEVAKRYRFFSHLLDKCRRIFADGGIDCFIPVDYPGFNIRLAKYAKKYDIPVFYYIAPQLWAWGKKRALSLSDITTKLFVVFPFEVDYFTEFGIKADFVGHPLMDNPQFEFDFKSYNQRNRNIAFFPGSREQEIRKHLSLFNDLLYYNRSKSYNFNFIIAKSPNIKKGLFNDILKYSEVQLSENNLEIMQNSAVGIIKTGTSNLEAALCGMPFAMFYKTSYLTFKIAERLVNLPYISIVNILSNKFVIEEFIQNNANPENILNYLAGILNSEKKYEQIQNEFRYIKKLLGNRGASARVAKIISENI